MSAPRARLERRWRRVGSTDPILCRRLGISRATSYRLEAAGFLPRPVRIGPRTTRWLISELEAFERRLVEDRGALDSHEAEP
jgi:predicted DNA-binding transcriptional regulator AlpA